MIKLTDEILEDFRETLETAINSSILELKDFADIDEDKVVINAKLDIAFITTSNEITKEIEYMPKIDFTVKSKIPKETKLSGSVDSDYRFIIDKDIEVTRKQNAQMSIYDGEKEK